MVKTDKCGIIHGVAQCDECDWDSVIDIHSENRMQDLRNRIYRHVNKTGHSVNLETGNSTRYYQSWPPILSE